MQNPQTPKPSNPQVVGSARLLQAHGYSNQALIGLSEASRGLGFRIPSLEFRVGGLGFGRGMKGVY